MLRKEKKGIRVGHRRIRGLRWARRADGPPPGLPRSRPRGAKAKGLRYEKALAAALPRALHGVWWQFEDANGPGWCQTDLLLRSPWGLVVLEAKYTWVPEGHSQLGELYLPVIGLAMGETPLGVVVCHTLRMGMWATPCDRLDDALDLAAGGEAAALHWIGVGPLWRVAGLGGLASPAPARAT